MRRISAKFVLRLRADDQKKKIFLAARHMALDSILLTRLIWTPSDFFWYPKINTALTA